MAAPRGRALRECVGTTQGVRGRRLLKTTQPVRHGTLQPLGELWGEYIAAAAAGGAPTGAATLRAWSTGELLEARATHCGANVALNYRKIPHDSSGRRPSKC